MNSFQSEPSDIQKQVSLYSNQSTSKSVDKIIAEVMGKLSRKSRRSKAYEQSQSEQKSDYIFKKIYKNERIMLVNKQLQKQNKQLKNKINNLQRKYNRLIKTVQKDQIFGQKYKQRKSQLQRLKNRLSKAQVINARMQSSISASRIALNQNKNKKNSKKNHKQQNKLITQAKQPSKINSLSPIIQFYNYQLSENTSRNQTRINNLHIHSNSKQIGIQIQIDQNQIWEQQTKLNQVIRQYEETIQQNNNIISQYESRIIKLNLQM